MLTGVNEGVFNGLTRVELVPPPPANVAVRMITYLRLYNRDSGTLTFTLERERLVPNDLTDGVPEAFEQILPASQLTTDTIEETLTQTKPAWVRQDQRIVGKLDAAAAATKPTFHVRWIDLSWS